MKKIKIISKDKSSQKSIYYYSSAEGYGGAEKYLEILAQGCSDNDFKCKFIVNSNNHRFQESLQRENLSWTGVDGFYDIFKTLKNEHPDILHINLPGPWGAHFIAPLAKAAGVKNVVTTEHLPMFGPSIRHSPRKYFDNRFVDRVITVSYENRKYLEEIHRIHPQKISVVHNGIDTQLFSADKYAKSALNFRKQFNIARKDFVFGIVGRITKQKGHVSAIEAFARIAQQHDNIKLTIVGDGELLSDMRQLVKKRGVDAQVIFAGFQSEMPKIYAAMDVLLMPSLFEALPLTLLEAMSMGTPVIASEINGIPEVITNGKDGLLIPPKNHQILFRNMKLLYLNSNLAAAIKKNASIRIKEKFSIEKMIIDTISTY